MANGERPNRRSIRLRGYDYSKPGVYFVTLKLEHNVQRFGVIGQGIPQLSPAGAMVATHWQALPSRFPTVALDAWVVMPDHMHGIIVLGDYDTSPGPTLGAVVGAFKSLTTNAYITGVRTQAWPPFSRRLWQRDYYERIVRDTRAMNAIRNYIALNPQRWKQ